MTKISEKLSKWRDYFGSTNSDIFDIIKNAVMVAAIDHPKEFKLRRDRIAELLFSCKNTRGLGCDKIEFVVPSADKVVPNADKVVPNDDEVVPNDVDVEGAKATKECDNEIVKELEGCDDKERKNEVHVNNISNVSYREAEALSDELEEEARVVEEVVRIKKIIDSNQKESDSNIYESLRRLQLMDISLDIMKDTTIGRSVNALRKHNSRNIRHLVKTLLRNWRGMVNEWMVSRAAFAVGTDRTPESMKAAIVDEKEAGLPSPPLEDLPYLSSIQSTSISLSKFFDGMDDDGNLQSNGESIKNHENERKISVENSNPVRKQPLTKNVTAAPKDNKDEQPKKQTSVAKPNIPPGDNSRPGRPTKPTGQRKLNNDEMKLLQKSDKSKVPMRPVPTQQNKLKCPHEDTAHVKFEAIKRKFQERYQEVENAKKQRTIQVLKLCDIPKKSLRKPGRPRNPQVKP